MNYKQAIKIMSDLVPKDISWSMDLEHWYWKHTDKHKETRRVWLSDPIRKFFGDEVTWQSAVDQALACLRDKGLIK